MPDTPACRAALRIALRAGSMPLDDGQIAQLEEYRAELQAEIDYIDMRVAQSLDERERRTSRAAWGDWLADRADIRDRQV